MDSGPLAVDAEAMASGGSFRSQKDRRNRQARGALADKTHSTDAQHRGPRRERTFVEADSCGVRHTVKVASLCDGLRVQLYAEPRWTVGRVG